MCLACSPQIAASELVAAALISEGSRKRTDSTRTSNHGAAFRARDTIDSATAEPRELGGRRHDLVTVDAAEDAVDLFERADRTALGTLRGEATLARFEVLSELTLGVDLALNLGRILRLVTLHGCA